MLNKYIYEYDGIIELKDLLNKYIDLCYRKGNFIPLPTNSINSKNLNQFRGTCFQIKDFWDITLKYIYMWYNEIDSNNPLKPLLDKNNEYFLAYGTNKQGWKNFVEKNYLKGFVNDNYEPINLSKEIFKYMNINNCKSDEDKQKGINSMQEYLKNIIRNFGK